MLSVKTNSLLFQVHFAALWCKGVGDWMVKNLSQRWSLCQARGFCIKKEILFIITLPTATFSIFTCTALTLLTFPWHRNESQGAVTCSKAICEHLGGSVNKRPGKHTGVQRSPYYLPSQPFLGISLPRAPHQVPDDAGKRGQTKK